MRASNDLLHEVPAPLPTMAWVTFSPHSFISLALVQHANSCKESCPTRVKQIGHKLPQKKKVTIWNGTEIICNANACSKFLVPNFYIDGWTQETCDPSMMRPQEVAYFCYFILWYLLWRSQRQSKQNQLIRREAWCVGLICFYFFPFVNTGNSFFIWMTAGMMGSRKR